MTFGMFSPHLKILPRVLKTDGRLIINFYNRLWEFPLKIAEKFNLAKPNLTQNWLTVDDAKNLLDLAGFEVIKILGRSAFSISIPLITPFSINSLSDYGLSNISQ